MPQTSPELFWLAAVALFTALLWLPYIVALIAQQGLVPALMDAQRETPLEAPWARRAQRAHLNAVENLVVFAALVLALEWAGANTGLTATAAAVYFWTRVAHWAVYVGGAPVVRTLLFAVGVACQAVIGITALGAL